MSTRRDTASKQNRTQQTESAKGPNETETNTRTLSFASLCTAEQ
jgi:hypothetical protein